MAAPHHPTGYAAPLIYIMRTNGELIVNRFGVEIGHEAISFEYVYDEEEDESCTIIIQTNDKFLPDHKFLQPKSNLMVQWGYNVEGGGKVLSPKRLITIRDVETKYGAKSIKHKLKCTDYVALLKEVRINAIREDHFINWLSEIAAGNYRATVHVNNSQLIEYNNEAPDLVEDQGEGTFKNVIYARENTAAPQTGVFYQTRIFKGKSKAIHAAIEDELKFAEGGPYFIDGRDNNINIRNRNFNQNVSWEFHYAEEPGEIIDFTPKTTYKKSNLEEKETNLVLALDKRILQSAASHTDNIDILNAKPEGITTASGQKITEGQHKDYLFNVLKPLFEQRVRSGNIDYIKDTEGNLTDKLSKPGFLEELQVAPNFKLDEVNLFITNGTQVPGINNVAAGQVNLSLGIDNTQAPLNVFEEIHLDIPAKEILALTETAELLAEERNEAMLDNHINEGKQRKVEARLTIIGNPELQTSKMLTIGGFANKHNGKWYTTSVSHKLTPNGGYVCAMDIIQRPKSGAKVKAVRNSKLTVKLQELVATAKSNTPVNKDIFTNEEFKSIVEGYYDANATVLQSGNEDEIIENFASFLNDPSGLASKLTPSTTVEGENDIPLNNQSQINTNISTNTSGGNTPNNENN